MSIFALMTVTVAALVIAGGAWQAWRAFVAVVAEWEEVEDNARAEK